MYDIAFTDQAKKQLGDLPRELQERILSVLERVRIRPDHYIKKLVGDKGYKIRVGDYRIIVDVDKQKITILIIKIGHRKNIYDI